MSDSNEFNRRQYQEHAAHYLETNVDGGIGGNNPEARVAFLQTVLPPNSKVLEIGSGGGLDALALQKKFRVTASDFVPAFVEILRKKNFNAIIFDAKHDNLPENFAAIYANAVLPHFSPTEILNFLNRAKPFLQNPKIIFMTIIKGEGSERSSRSRGFDRDFHYYTLESLTKILTEAGFKILETKDPDTKWLQVICQAI